jgi:SAM-dependent methyltransferase
MEALRQRDHPEIRAGGYSRIDGTVEFFTRVQALLPDRGVVVDLGAGRGKWQEDPCRWRRTLSDLRGRHRVVVAADIDNAVAGHPAVDARVLLPPEGWLPFEDGSISVVVADWVLEHVGDPDRLAGELRRVLAPGGWICARTPNKWGYVGVGARLVPNQRHVGLLRRLQPDRQSQDVFDVRYRLNTRAALRRTFGDGAWVDCTYPYGPDADYVGASIVARKLVRAWQRVAPAALATTLHVFLQRRPGEPAASPGGAPFADR